MDLPLSSVRTALIERSSVLLLFLLRFGRGYNNNFFLFCFNLPRWPMWVWPAAGQVCARRVSQWRNVSGAFRRRFPVRVSCRRLRASILHRHGPLLPTEVLRHVPGPQTEVPLVHLVNVSSSEVEISICDLRTLTLCSDFLLFSPFFLFYLLFFLPPPLAIQLHSDTDP